ncbi:MAG: DUF47 family protein [Eubacteriales bacterium]|nr:DUF47 family protein [Eubacteriales bacterium]
MLGFKKKETHFNHYLVELCEKIETAADAFADIVNDYEDVEDKIANMKVLETECDLKTHEIIQALRNLHGSTWEREDIHNLVREMDNIVDSLEEAANRFLVFDIKEIKPQACDMAALTQQAVEELKNMFELVPEMKASSQVQEKIIEVNRIENDGDLVYRQALSVLFREEKDPIELIKWKHLFEQMENSLDSCETVANIFEGVLTRYE